MKKFLPAVCASPLFRGVPAQEIPGLLTRLEAKAVSYPKNDFILHAGAPVTSLGLIVDGHVLVVREDFWGRRNLMAALGPGQCFAETFACVPGSVLGVSVTAQTACTVLFLNVQQLLASGGNSPLLRTLMADMAAKNLAFTEKLTHLGQRTTRERLLSYLSAQAQKQGRVEFDIPLSRQQLADYLLVERSGLSRELCRMRDEGLLEFRKNHFLLKHHTPL